MAEEQTHVRVAELIHTAKITLGVTHHVPPGNFVAFAGDQLVAAGPLYRGGRFVLLPDGVTDLWLGSEARGEFMHRAQKNGVDLTYADGRPVILDREHD